MRRTAVVSSSLASIGYQPSHHTLEVEFCNGSIYRYFDVPQHLYESLMSADSLGRCFNENIRDAGFEFEQLA